MLKKTPQGVVFVRDKHINHFLPPPPRLTPSRADPAHGINVYRLFKPTPSSPLN
jgi:hypothetical protein